MLSELAPNDFSAFKGQKDLKGKLFSNSKDVPPGMLTGLEISLEYVCVVIRGESFENV